MRWGELMRLKRERRISVDGSSGVDGPQFRVRTALGREPASNRPPGSVSLPPVLAAAKMKAARLALLCLAVLAGCSEPAPVNPCIDTYPAIAGHVVGGPAGRVAGVQAVDWLEEGVYRITVESGGDIMVKPDGLPLPQIGADLEVRIFSETANSEPLAGCYCQIGTNVCVEEYSYP